MMRVLADSWVSVLSQASLHHAVARWQPCVLHHQPRQANPDPGVEQGKTQERSKRFLDDRNWLDARGGQMIRTGTI